DMTFGAFVINVGTTSEMDEFEAGKFNNPSDPNNAQSSIQPYYLPGHSTRYVSPVSSGDPTLTIQMVWQPHRLDVYVLQGAQTPASFAKAKPVYEQIDTASNAFVPSPANQLQRFNIWETNGAAPANGQPFEV